MAAGGGAGSGVFVSARICARCCSVNAAFVLNALDNLGGDPALFTDPIHIPVNYDYIYAKDAQ